MGFFASTVEKIAGDVIVAVNRHPERSEGSRIKACRE
jgi:hypothetical protein